MFAISKMRRKRRPLFELPSRGSASRSRAEAVSSRGEIAETIASTAEAYAAAWLAPRAGETHPVADALTVNPYLGGDSLAPFVAACDAHGGGIYVLARTSNPGGAGTITVNEKPGQEYFARIGDYEAVTAPLRAIGQEGKFNITIKVVGGGSTGQAK